MGGSRPGAASRSCDAGTRRKFRRCSGDPPLCYKLRVAWPGDEHSPCAAAEPEATSALRPDGAEAIGCRPVPCRGFVAAVRPARAMERPGGRRRRPRHRSHATGSPLAVQGARHEHQQRRILGRGRPRGRVPAEPPPVGDRPGHGAGGEGPFVRTRSGRSSLESARTSATTAPRARRAGRDSEGGWGSRALRLGSRPEAGRRELRAAGAVLRARFGTAGSFGSAGAQERKSRANCSNMSADICSESMSTRSSSPWNIVENCSKLSRSENIPKP